MPKAKQQFEQIEARRQRDAVEDGYMLTPPDDPRWRAMMDHYHMRYSQQTYLAFDKALKPFGLGVRHGDVMNLFIDASLEVCGQVVGCAAYPGAVCKLLREIDAAGDGTGELYMLALGHLCNFMAVQR